MALFSSRTLRTYTSQALGGQDVSMCSTVVISLSPTMSSTNLRATTSSTFFLISLTRNFANGGFAHDFGVLRSDSIGHHDFPRMTSYIQVTVVNLEFYAGIRNPFLTIPSYIVF